MDTDCVSLILYNHPQVIANAAKHQFAITIITVQELFNGWVVRINDPSQVHNLPALYSKLWTTVKYLQTIEVLNWVNTRKPNLFFPSQSYPFPPCQWDDWKKNDCLRHAARSHYQKKCDRYREIGD
nr:hypothetical protein [Argonema antarcticum]